MQPRKKHGLFACEMLRSVLARLEQGPAAVATILDWGIMYWLLKRHAAQRGFVWHELTAWNNALDLIRIALADPENGHKPLRLTIADLATHQNVIEAVRWQSESLGEPLDWKRLEEVLQLQQELFELATRFGEVSERGLFHALDAAGVLNHHIEGVDHIDDAMFNPPAQGRASVRGRVIQRVQSDRDHYSCDWSSIYDAIHHRRLDLSDPFATDEKWTVGPPIHPSRISEDSAELDARRLHQQLESAYERCAFDAAARLVDDQVFAQARISNNSQRVYAWVQSRRGFFDGRELLLLLEEREAVLPLWLAADYAYVYRFTGGLLPSAETEHWIRRGHEAAARQQEGTGSDISLLEHLGFWQLAQGQWTEARVMLEAIVAEAGPSRQSHRSFGRALGGLGEVYRRLGDRRRALKTLTQCRNLLQQLGREGDVAEFALLPLAKFQRTRDRALAQLAAARTLLADKGNATAEARLLLLEARIAADRCGCEANKARLHELRQERTVLGQCPLLTRILDHRWDEWTSGDRTTDEHGDTFWGV